MRYSDDGLARTVARAIPRNYDLPTEMEGAVSNTCFHCGCEVKEGEDCCPKCLPGKSRTSVSQLIHEGYPREVIDTWQEAGLLSE